MPLSLISLFVAVDQLELDSNYSVPVHYSVMLRKFENKTRETSVLDAFIQCTPQKKGTINLAGPTVQPDFMTRLHLYVMKKYQKKNRGQM